MAEDNSQMKGFFRVQLSEDEEDLVGDSGWNENQVTNLGIRDYLVDNLTGNSGQQEVTHVNLGTGGEPASADTSLTGELSDVSDARQAVSTSIVSSRTAQFTAAFNSNDSFVTTSHDISNVGLFNQSGSSGGTLFAGNTYSSSSLDTNQNVNMTYQIRFS